jgi:hypothetical protein
MKKELKELKETFYKLDIQKCNNGFILYVNNTLKYDQCVPDTVFVFNKLKDLTDFLLTYKELEN